MSNWIYKNPLQQSLPFTVLKLIQNAVVVSIRINEVATVLTVYGIETLIFGSQKFKRSFGCNSPYRLRY